MPIILKHTLSSIRNHENYFAHEKVCAISWTYFFVWISFLMTKENSWVSHMDWIGWDWIWIRVQLKMRRETQLVFWPGSRRDFNSLSLLFFFLNRNNSTLVCLKHGNIWSLPWSHTRPNVYCVYVRRKRERRVCYRCAWEHAILWTLVHRHSLAREPSSVLSCKLWHNAAWYGIKHCYFHDSMPALTVQL